MANNIHQYAWTKLIKSQIVQCPQSCQSVPYLGLIFSLLTRWVAFKDEKIFWLFYICVKTYLSTNHNGWSHNPWLSRAKCLAKKAFGVECVKRFVMIRQRFGTREEKKDYLSVQKKKLCLAKNTTYEALKNTTTYTAQKKWKKYENPLPKAICPLHILCILCQDRSLYPSTE